MDVNRDTSEQHETFPLDKMEVNHRKLLRGLEALIFAAEHLNEKERSQEKGKLPPHSVHQPVYG